MRYEAVHRAARRNSVGWWDESSGTTHLAPVDAPRTLCGVRVPADAGLDDTRWTRGPVMRIYGTPEQDDERDDGRADDGAAV